MSCLAGAGAGVGLRRRAGGLGLDPGDLGARLGDRLRHVEEVAAKTLIGLLVPFAPNHGLDAFDRGKHLEGVGVAVAAGVFVEEPAPACAFRHGRANDVVLALRRRLGRDCG